MKTFSRSKKPCRTPSFINESSSSDDGNTAATVDKANTVDTAETAETANNSDSADKESDNVTLDSDEVNSSYFANFENLDGEEEQVQESIDNYDDQEQYPSDDDEENNPYIKLRNDNIKQRKALLAAAEAAGKF